MVLRGRGSSMEAAHFAESHLGQGTNLEVGIPCQNHQDLEDPEDPGDHVAQEDLGAPNPVVGKEETCWDSGNQVLPEVPEDWDHRLRDQDENEPDRSCR